MEKNMNFWNGCMKEDIDAYVIMREIVIDGEKCNYCHLCNEAWALDYEQIPFTSTHKQTMKSIARHMRDVEKNPQDYED